MCAVKANGFPQMWRWSVGEVVIFHASLAQIHVFKRFEMSQIWEYRYVCQLYGTFTSMKCQLSPTNFEMVSFRGHFAPV